MIILKYILLGIIQGFTEPLPISSSGHLRIIKNFLNDEIWPIQKDKLSSKLEKLEILC